VISLGYSAVLNSAARAPRQTGALHGGTYAVVADTAGMGDGFRVQGSGFRHGSTYAVVADTAGMPTLCDAG
jgi:acyl-coenzyme A thioesterase PaaI-like protein